MKPKVLFVVISQLDHQDLWEEILEKDSDNIVIVCGKALEDGENYIFKDRILYVNCNDAYEGEPEKLGCAITAILEMDEFDDYTHMLRVNDDISKINDILVQKLTEHPDLCAVDDENEFTHHYLGNQLSSKIDKDWHIGKCSEDSPWNTKSYEGPYTNYLNASGFYILSRNAMNLINAQCNFDNLEEIREAHVWEDVMVSLLLLNWNIRGKYLSNGNQSEPSLKRERGNGMEGLSFNDRSVLESIVKQLNEGKSLDDIQATMAKKEAESVTTIDLAQVDSQQSA